MSEILRLRSLASAPTAQGEYAVSLVKPRQKRDILLAALQALVKAPTPAGHEPILQTYAYFSADGRKRDPGAFMRRAALDALRPVALPADVPLLLQATNTYEFLPPGFKEDAILLRAGALLILNELDDTLAGYQATRLLVDGYSDPMSGEPALHRGAGAGQPGANAAALSLRDASQRCGAPRSDLRMPAQPDRRARGADPRHHRAARPIREQHHPHRAVRPAHRARGRPAGA